MRGILYGISLFKKQILKTIFYPLLKKFLLSSLPILLAAIFFGSALHSCTEPDQLGLQFIDDQAMFKRTDTLSVVGFMEIDDSVPTNLSFQNLLGMMHDPVFGKTRASIVAEFRLPTNNFTLGTRPVLDSLVMGFHYTGDYAGNVETLQTVRVFELKENLPQGDRINSNHPVQIYNTVVGERILRPAPRDSVLVDTIFRHPHFTMRLSDQLGQKIINANGTAAFRNVQNFLEYFKGLKVTVANDFNEGGAIFNIDMFGSFTSLTLYYHDAADTVRRQRTQSFRITSFAQRFTHVEHFDFQNANPFLRQLLQTPQQTSDSLLFVKSLGGLRSRIRLPHLMNIAQMPNVTINQAKLIVPVDELFVTEGFDPAQFLHIYQITPQGAKLPIRDSGMDEEYFGGEYDPATKQFTFNITKHLQEVLKGVNPNNDLAIVVSGASDNARRVVFRGPGRQSNPLRVQIVYTSFR